MSQGTEAAINCPEVEMLLLCVRPQLDGADSQRVRAIVTAGCDWDVVLDLAGAHGVTSLLHRGLNMACPDLVPDTVLRTLRARVRQNAIRGLALSGALVRVLRPLEQNSIQAVPFKGPVLATLAYGDATAREFGDLDILVRRPEAKRARAVLMSQGFTSEMKAAGFDEAPPVHKHYGLTDPESHAHVEVHWRFSYDYVATSTDYHGLWGRLKPLSFMGASVPCLDLRDLLAALCEHGQSHCWARVSLICDLAWLIASHAQADWASIVASATGDGRRQRPVFLGLCLANQLLGTPIPAAVRLQMDADRRLEPLAARIRQRILSDRPHEIDPHDAYIFHLRAAGSLADKMLYSAGLVCLALTPTPTDQAALPLPRCLHLLYYPIRPIRLALRATRWAVHGRKVGT